MEGVFRAGISDARVWNSGVAGSRRLWKSGDRLFSSRDWVRLASDTCGGPARRRSGDGGQQSDEGSRAQGPPEGKVAWGRREDGLGIG